eukprot:5488547-Prymnesium_polylepis.1
MPPSRLGTAGGRTAPAAAHRRRRARPRSCHWGSHQRLGGQNAALNALGAVLGSILWGYGVLPLVQLTP